MNRRMIIHTVGRIAQAEAVLMVLPALVALCYLETAGWSFLGAIAISAVLTYGFERPVAKVLQKKWDAWRNRA